MRLSEDQVKLFSRYFADLSKIIFTSVVIGFFIPSEYPLPLWLFILGTAITILLLAIASKFAQIQK